MGYLPDTTVHRLETAARVHLARQSRWLDTDTDPQDVIDDWLAELERARVETPTPENGDLLVKQHRGELWLLTAAGWRELAPLELQTDPPAETVDAPRYFGKGALETELDRRIEADRLVEHGDPDVGQGVKAAGPPWPLFVQDVLDDLAGRSVVVHQAAATLNEAEAVAEIDLLDSMRAFADGLDAARRRLLDAATEACWHPPTPKET